jgi:hypothetical protein
MERSQHRVGDHHRRQGHECNSTLERAARNVVISRTGAVATAMTAIREEYVTDLTSDGKSSLSFVVPGIEVVHVHDEDAWGIIIAVKNEGWVTVLWSTAPDWCWFDNCYDEFDNYYDDCGPWVTPKSIKEIWDEDNKRSRRDDSRRYGSEKQRMRREMRGH